MQTDRDPAESAATVTKSDTTVLRPTRSLFVGGAGNVAVKMADGRTVTFTGVVDGTILPVRVTQVLDATTATNIVAMW